MQPEKSDLLHYESLNVVPTKKFVKVLAETKTAYYYCCRVYRGWPVLRLAFFCPVVKLLKAGKPTAGSGTLLCVITLRYLSGQALTSL